MTEIEKEALGPPFSIGITYSISKQERKWEIVSSEGGFEIPGVGI